jgi:hypothetical protein
VSGPREEPAFGRFEREVVWRVSRTLFLGMACLAALSAVGAALTGAYGVMPSWQPSPPAMPEPPAPAPVTAEQLRSLIAPEKPVAAAAPVQAAVAAAPVQAADPGVDPELALLADAHARIAARFDVSVHPWLDKVGRTCERSNWMGGCMSYRTRVLLPGAQSLLEEVEGQIEASQRLGWLNAVDALLAAAPDSDDDRYVHVGVVKSFAGAWGGQDRAIRALIGLYEGGPTPKDDLDDPQRRLVAAQAIAIGRASPAVELLERWVSLFAPAAEGGARRAWDGPLLPASWALVSALSPDELVAAMGLVDALVAERGVEVGAPAARAYLELRSQHEAAASAQHAAAMSEHMAKVAALELAAAASAAAKAQAISTAPAWFMGSVGTVAMLGLLLALLAVERNTRALQAVVARFEEG